MTQVVFFDKPGCLTNSRQRAMLAALGHDLDVRNLLAEDWTPERLRPYFADLPVPQWFNPSAPRIKSGEVDPRDLDPATALSLMVADPLLIRRPLIDTPAGSSAGFRPGPTLEALGVRFEPGLDLAGCSRPDTGHCPIPPQQDGAPT